ncbi:hypothetical protein [Streptomyces sp. MNP-20]|uniref:hypothetical protein n=1 Tax=Streptomyces sp. MNP-20 TaxID=2721165 RepID=UPI0015580E0A|nr:hypothetical protein [Streptomyces sp. MNP-20]
MRHPLRRLARRLKARLAPLAPGRHTAAHPNCPPHPPRVLPQHVQARARPLVGEDIALVRPYLLAHEAHHEQRARQHGYRAALAVDDHPTVRLVAI